MEEKLVVPPKYLQDLEISGLVSGFPAWVENLRELTKVTLHKTLLKADDIRILGKLIRLCYLRLWQESCIERTLTFSKDEFQGLKFLVIQCSDVTTINFGDKATPKLKKLVWISTGSQSQSLTGIEQLLSLKVLKVAGNFNTESLKLAIAANTNDPILETDDAPWPLCMVEHRLWNKKQREGRHSVVTGDPLIYVCLSVVLYWFICTHDELLLPFHLIYAIVCCKIGLVCCILWHGYHLVLKKFLLTCASYIYKL